MTNSIKDPSAAAIGFGAAVVGLVVIGIAVWGGPADATAQAASTDTTYAVSAAQDILQP